MPVRIEKSDAVWTVIHSRPETRDAMDPDSATALYEAFRTFDSDEIAHVAVFWGEGGSFCSGWDLKHAAALSGAEALDPFDFPTKASLPWPPWDHTLASKSVSDSKSVDVVRRC